MESIAKVLLAAALIPRLYMVIVGLITIVGTYQLCNWDFLQNQLPVFPNGCDDIVLQEGLILIPSGWLYFFFGGMSFIGGILAVLKAGSDMRLASMIQNFAIFLMFPIFIIGCWYGSTYATSDANQALLDSLDRYEQVRDQCEDNNVTDGICEHITLLITSQRVILMWNRTAIAIPTVIFLLELFVGAVCFKAKQSSGDTSYQGMK